MSKEVLELARKMGFREIETKLILQCSPFITGLRPSSLLIISLEEYDVLIKILRKTKISYRMLLKNKDRTVVFLYDDERLEQYLSVESSEKLLMDMGYTDSEVSKVIAEFEKRYKNYYEGVQDFPHEMGIMLGYPIEDVEGFIRNKGRNFLYSGYWKVYENIEEKKHLFKKFEKARDNLMVLLASGIGVSDIINIYGNNKEIAI